jgi:hypothetical protein
MRKVCTLVLFALLVLAATGCGRNGNGTPQPGVDPVPDINLIADDAVPEIVQNSIDLETQNQYVYQTDDGYYLIATMGQKNTAGYAITYTGYRDNQDHTWDVFLETSEPAEGEDVAQVLTYPVAYARFSPDLPIFTVRFHIDGTLITEKQTEPLEAGVHDTEVTLYFGTPDAYLRKELRSVPDFLLHNVPIQAEIILSELLSGTISTDDTVNVIPDGTHILRLDYVTPGNLVIITVSAHFAGLEGSAGEQLGVYSIVNSLTELQGVDAVTIYIEGGELTHMDQLENLTYNADLLNSSAPSV